MCVWRRCLASLCSKLALKFQQCPQPAACTGGAAFRACRPWEENATTCGFQKLSLSFVSCHRGTVLPKWETDETKDLTNKCIFHLHLLERMVIALPAGGHWKNGPAEMEITFEDMTNK